MAKKYIYFFGGKKAEGNTRMRNKLGGKGAGIAEMVNIGIPVPAGFTITTEVCTHFMNKNGAYPQGLRGEVKKNMRKIEQAMGGKFGDPQKPLLISVRSGARTSMPGMMDTILNLGLNDTTVKGMIDLTQDPRFVYDSYRRFIHMYANVAMGIDAENFEHILEKTKKAAGAKTDQDLDSASLKGLVKKYKAVVKKIKKVPFPDDPEEQLWGAISAVFNSWNIPRAVSYRRMHGIPNDWGTAVNVQAMVFGNMGEDSATGVAFTRDPSTGERIFFGEYLTNAQGEDVVAGLRTPLPINTAGVKRGKDESLEKKMGDIYKQLEAIYKKLEKHFKDMQDIEFTIQEQKLWLLQTRNGKRTGKAAVKIAVDMVKEKLINKKTAILRVEPDQLEQLLHPMIDPKVKEKPLAKGLPASPGANSGRVAFTVEETLKLLNKGEPAVLVRVETSPDDIEGMKAAEAILTSKGGMTSHAAVVARGMGKTCIVGCGDIYVDYGARSFKVGNEIVRSGEWITIDGSGGRVFKGTLPTVDSVLDDDYYTFMKWVDEFRKMGVRANADTPEDARNARKFGAEGIGLARTEHMFFEEKRIPVVRRMIMSSTREERMVALRKILPMQRKDFVGVFRAMDGFPVTIRLLDPPLHEFLPEGKEKIEALAEQLGMSYEDLKKKVDSLHEFNPMLGHRGCRLGITFPEIYEIQVQAIIEAACQVKKQGIVVKPEIMIPLVGTREELAQLRTMVETIAADVLKKKKMKLPYLTGTMIEVPRAALRADRIAEVSDFFSFGTNDLTQMTFGFSRDDAGKFLEEYIARGILPKDPFESLDKDGVGELVRIAVKRGRKQNPKLKVGICGEHGGDPESVYFCHAVGLNYVSCSPFRLPIARLAAARASL